MNRSYLRISALLLVPLAGACASATTGPAPAVPTTPATVAEAPADWTMPNDLHWSRNSAERMAIYEMVYARATTVVEELVDARSTPVAAEGEGEPWAVILDADETILDNSTYQVEQDRQGLGYASETWNAWVRREAAPVLPGALAFTRRVKQLGGHVAIVTNRDVSVCAETENNLRDVGVPFDVVLCRGPETREKEVRFRMVEEGTTHEDLPPMEVLAWVGDNIEDFPGGTQGLRQGPVSGFRDFGRRFFILPNPMYGSWESNQAN